MKLKRIQLIYIVVTLLLVGSFFAGGARGYRFLSVFTATHIVTGTPTFYHK